MSAPVDIRGQQFGELTAIEPTDRRRGSNVIWRCRCSCGKEVFATAKDLRSGNTKSCGHTRRQDITGQRFGRLTAIETTDIAVAAGVVWRCRCDCGNEIYATIKDLRSSNTQSCGCLNRKKRPTPPDFVGRTRIAMLNSRPTKSNTSGVRGVSWSKQKQDWEAYIKFKGHFYHLGHFKRLEDAAKARARAEERLFSPAIEEWKVPHRKRKSPAMNIHLTTYGKYNVYFQFNGEKINVGVFATLPEAIAARDEKRAELGLQPIPHE